MENNSVFIELVGHVVQLAFSDCTCDLSSYAESKAQEAELSLQISSDGAEEDVSFQLDKDSFTLTGPTGQAKIDLVKGEGIIRCVPEHSSVHLDNALRHVANLFIRNEGGSLLHGISLVVDGEVHVFAGPSNAGKSTLAQICSDWPLVSDEFVFLLPGPTVVLAPPFGHEQRVKGLVKKLPLQSVSILLQGEKESWSTLPRSVILARLTQNPTAKTNPLRETERLQNILSGVELYSFTFSLSEQVSQYIVNTVRERRRKRFLGAVVNLLGGELAKGRTAWLKVATGSMKPTIQPGDRVLVKGVEAKELSIGDLVVFQRGGEMILHRLLAKKKRGFLTAGDNSRCFDPLVDNNEVVGRVVSVEREGKRVHFGSSFHSRAKALALRTKLNARGALRWVYHGLRHLVSRRGNPHGR